MMADFFHWNLINGHSSLVCVRLNKVSERSQSGADRLGKGL